MPTVTNAKLALDREGANVKISVTYDVNLSQLESNLAGFGLAFTELIQVFGVDAPQVRTETTLQAAFGVITVTPKNQAQVLERKHILTVPRAILDEDPDILFIDEDELIARIRVRAHGLQLTPGDAFTNQAVLSDVGGILVND